MSEEQKTKSCFVICPIGDEGSPIREQSDEILEYIIAPAVEECGYEPPVRADAIAEPGNITLQVIQRVDAADLVVADLTGHNPNVFYEIAVRHAVRKPLILIMERLTGYENVPFDISQDRVIFYTHNVKQVHECRQKIVDQIRYMEESSSKLNTPISNAIDIKFMRESGDAQEESLGKILEKLEDVLREIRRAKTEHTSEATDTLEGKITIINEPEKSGGTGRCCSYAYFSF